MPKKLEELDQEKLRDIFLEIHKELKSLKERVKKLEKENDRLSRDNKFFMHMENSRSLRDMGKERLK